MAFLRSVTVLNCVVLRLTMQWRRVVWRAWRTASQRGETVVWCCGYTVVCWACYNVLCFFELFCCVALGCSLFFFCAELGCAVIGSNNLSSDIPNRDG